MKRISLLFYILLMSLAVAPIHGQDTDTLHIWSRFNTDTPQVSSDAWLSELIERYNAAQPDVTLENTFYPYDQINTAVNIAVQTGVNVPDMAYIDTEQLGFYDNNEALVDLTEFITSATWYDDLDASALQTCTTPDGRILCVPSTTSNYYTYYWTSVYPNGYPVTTEEFLALADGIKADGHYPLTFKAAEPVSVERFYVGLMLSYGATLADENGRATWANTESVEAMMFVRTLFEQDYVPQVALAPQFEYEEPFKQGTAGSFVAGTFSYVYLSPLTSPTGTRFEQEITGQFDNQALAIGAANAAGELGFAPPMAAPNGKPVSVISGEGWAIPYGTGNLNAAMDFINYQMSAEENVLVSVAGGKLPVLTSAQEAPAYDSLYWQQAITYRQEYGTPAPAWSDYGTAQQLLSEAIVKIITDPNADTLAVLLDAQNEYNLLVENR